MYVPKIVEGSKTETRSQNLDHKKLPTDENTLFLLDANCHGSWDHRINLPDDKMADRWEDWMSDNQFSYLNTPFSYTRKDVNGKKSSPDISLVHNNLLGKCTWTPQKRTPGGSDNIPLFITIDLH